MKSVFLPKDQNGNTVHVHGGQILQYDGWYYWIGEDRTGRNKVSCYRSKDLENWEFRNHILTVDSKTQKFYADQCVYRLGTESGFLCICKESWWRLVHAV